MARKLGAPRKYTHEESLSLVNYSLKLHEDIHRKFKVKCADRGASMCDVVRYLIERYVKSE